VDINLNTAGPHAANASTVLRIEGGKDGGAIGLGTHKDDSQNGSANVIESSL
jgi:hypothetical protein